MILTDYLTTITEDMNPSRLKKILAAFCLMLFFCQQAVAQNDSLDFTRAYADFDREYFNRLPVLTTDGLMELNPSLVRLFKPSSYCSDGFSATGDYIWLDGVPVRFMEELPLRLIGKAGFLNYPSDLYHGNSLIGNSLLESVRTTDSVEFIMDGSFSEIHGRVNDYDYQLVLSGPILLRHREEGRKVRTSGLFASRIFHSMDPDPSYIERLSISGEYRNYLEQAPLRPNGLGNGTYANALFTKQNNSKGAFVENNAQKKGYFLYGRLVLEFGPGMSLSASTQYLSKNEMVPVYENYFFNPDGNPLKTTDYSNNYLRFDDQFDLGESSTFRYHLMGQYSSLKSKLCDPDLGNDFFKYGYTGRFDTYRAPTFQPGSDTVNGQYYPQAWVLNSWDYSYLVDYTPGAIHPNLSNYTSSYYSLYPDDPAGHYQNLDQVVLCGGLVNGQSPGRVYGLWNNLGTVHNRFETGNESQWRAYAHGELDMGRHKLLGGVQFSRTTYSSYEINPVDLWPTLRGGVNFHLYELDLENPVLHPGEEMDSIFYYRKYNPSQQSVMDARLRNILGLDPEGLDFIDIDSYDYSSNTMSYYDKEGHRHTLHLEAVPLSIDLFTPEDLYWGADMFLMGYDHTGKRMKGNVSFDDFFNQTNEEGVYLRPCAPYIPMTYSGYTDYHLTEGTWRLKTGIRLDVFDANQMVLVDPYLFQEAHTAEFLSNDPSLFGAPPVDIGRDFIVYVDHSWAPSRYVGFRDGDTWYDVNGKEVTDPNVLDVGSGISPYLVNPGLNELSPDAFTSARSHFSFLPHFSIQKFFNKKILLTINYYSASQIPQPEAVMVNLAQHYYFIQGLNISNGSLEGNFIPNGSLGPERADKTMAGIAWEIWDGILLTAEAYANCYSQLIRPVHRKGAFPRSYLSLENSEEPLWQYGVNAGIARRPAGTSGFGYGLTSHFLKDNPSGMEYFPSFSMARLILKGHLLFNTGYGTDYKGPSGKAAHTWFERIGTSMMAHYHSGIQYKRLDGTTAVLPAAVLFDLKVEKGFHFGQRKDHMLNFYIIVQNLLNTKVIYKVYSRTGEPDDDGFLSDPFYQNIINSQVDSESFRFLYSSYINNPSNYGLPRRISFGMTLHL